MIRISWVVEICIGQCRRLFNPGSSFPSHIYAANGLQYLFIYNSLAMVIWIFRGRCPPQIDRSIIHPITINMIHNSLMWFVGMKGVSNESMNCFAFLDPFAIDHPDNKVCIRRHIWSHSLSLACRGADNITLVRDEVSREIFYREVPDHIFETGQKGSRVKTVVDEFDRRKKCRSRSDRQQCYTMADVWMWMGRHPYKYSSISVLSLITN